MSADHPKCSELLEHVGQVYPAMALLAGHAARPLHCLEDGPNVAGTIGADASRPRRLMQVLAGAGFLKLRDGRFANTALTDDLLVRGKPSYVGGVHELWADLWAATLKTAESVRTGQALARHDFGAMSDEELRAFFRGHGSAVMAGRTLAGPLGLAGHRRLLDVGGGSAGLAIGACETIPQYMRNRH